MKRLASGALAAFASLAMTGDLESEAAARGVTVARLKPDPVARQNYLIDGHYLRSEPVIARMRARGELPDMIRAGHCSFGLAGDPGVVYYVRTCR